MADANTFKVRPIAKLLARYVGDGKGWIDPFAGDNSPAEFTNDINPNRKAIRFCNCWENEEYHWHIFGLWINFDWLWRRWTVMLRLN